MMFLCFLVLDRLKKLPFKLPVVAFLFALASLLGFLSSRPAHLLSEYGEEELPITVQVEEITYEEGSFVYFNGIITEIDGEKARFKAKCYCYDAPRLSPGDVAQGVGEIRALSSFCDATGDERSLLTNGFHAKVTLSKAEAVDRFLSVSLFFSRLRSMLSARLCTALTDESGALISGLLLGDTTRVSPVLVRNMNRLGISHLLAISGMHFTVLFIGLEKLLGKLGVSKRARLALVAVFSLFYLALTGFSSAIMRAGFMLLLMIITYFLRLHYDSLTSLGLSLFLICVFTPYAVYHAGLWLSAFATFGILALNERRNKPRSAKKKRSSLWVSVRDSLAITAVAIIATSPLTSLLFGTFPLLSPVANLLLSPLMDLLLYLAPLLLFFPRFSPLVRLADGTVALFTKVTAALAEKDAVLTVSHPLIVTPLILTAVTLLAYLCFTQRRIKLFIPATILLVGVLITGTGYDVLAFSEKDTAEITFYSTESPSDGEMFLLSSEGRHGVIDHSKGKLSFYSGFCSHAAERHILEFDFYILTTYDQTENENFLYLMESKFLREIYLPAPVTQKEERMLAAFEKRTEAAGSKVVLYDGEPFSPCEITLRSLSVGRNRYNAAPGFSITYDTTEILFFSPAMDYDPSFYFWMQEADAVFFGALGEMKDASFFPSTIHFNEIAFFCTDENKTPFENPDRCTVTQTHTFSLKRQKSK